MISADQHYIIYYSHIIFGIACIHAYAFTNSVVNYRYLKTDFSKLVIALNGLCLIHSLCQVLILSPISHAAKYHLAHLILLETYLILPCYITAISIFLNYSIPGFRYLKIIFTVGILFLFAGYIYFSFTGKSIIFTRKLIETSNIMYNYNNLPIGPNPLASAFFGFGIITFIIFCSKSLFEIIRTKNADYFVAFGMIISISANLNDISIFYTDSAYIVPLFVVSNFVECLRLTFVAQQKSFSNFAESNAMANSVRRVIHDIRRPFSQIRIFLINLSERIKNEDPVLVSKVEKLKYAVSKSYTEVDRLLSELLDIGREVKLELEYFDPVELIEDSIANIFSDQQQTKWSIHIVAESGETIFADRLKLKRVLENILANADNHARKKTEKRLSLVINGKKRDKNYLLKITNSGSVIPQSKLLTIFDQFYTSNNATGKGIGLAICKKFIDLHGGSIYCRSNLSKNSTTFVISVPAEP